MRTFISLWLNQKGRRSQNTKRVYEHEVTRFLDIVQKPLRAVTVVDMQGYMEPLGGPGSVRRYTGQGRFQLSGAYSASALKSRVCPLQRHSGG